MLELLREESWLCVCVCVLPILMSEDRDLY